MKILGIGCQSQHSAALDLDIARQLGHQGQVGAADIDVDQLHFAELLDIVDLSLEQIIRVGRDHQILWPHAEAHR